MERLIIGIDFGNTNSSLSYRIGHERRASLLPISDDFSKSEELAAVLRSAVRFSANGDAVAPVVGRAALTAIGNGFLVKDFKRELLDTINVPDTSGTTAQDALIHVMRSLREYACAEQHLESNLHALSEGAFTSAMPLHLCLGTPADVSDLYKNRLQQALVASGWFASEESLKEAIRLQRLQFVAEPVAVLLNFRIPNHAKRKGWIVLDFGGLTLDLALAVTDGQRIPPFQIIDKTRVVHEMDGRHFDVGGTLLDRLILRHLVAEHGLAAVAAKASKVYHLEVEERPFGRYIEMQRDVTGADRHTPAAMLYERLCLDMESARIKLSDLTVQHVPILYGENKVLVPPVDSGIVFTRGEFNSQILAPVLRSLHDTLTDLWEKKPPALGDPDIVLAGGCSQTPELLNRLREQYGTQRVLTPGDFSPLVTVASGLSCSVGDGVTLYDDVVDADYGVWDSMNRRFETIIKNGMEVEDTEIPETGMPADGEGIFRQFIAETKYSTMLHILVGQRRRGEEWHELGARTVYLPAPGIKFRIYFSIDQRLGMLKMHVADAKNQRMIPVENPLFDIIKVD